MTNNEELLGALDGELSDTHRFVASQILEHIVSLEALSVERNAPRWIRMLRKYGYITAWAFARACRFILGRYLAHRVLHPPNSHLSR